MNFLVTVAGNDLAYHYFEHGRVHMPSRAHTNHNEIICIFEAPLISKKCSRPAGTHQLLVMACAQSHPEAHTWTSRTPPLALAVLPEAKTA